MKSIKRIARSILDIILPRLCPVCRKRLTINEEGVCFTCLRHMKRTRHEESPYDNRLARMLWGKMKVWKAAAIFIYVPKGYTSRTIYDMKYHGRKSLCTTMGKIAAAQIEATGFFDGIDMIVPIPLAKKRKRQRGYNQSELFAGGISLITGIPVRTEAVERISFNTSQTKLTHYERAKNVEKAFKVKKTELIDGKHILLVDDVFTTGATIISCGNEMAKTQGVKISVLTLSAVVFH